MSRFLLLCVFFSFGSFCQGERFSEKVLRSLNKIFYPLPGSCKSGSSKVKQEEDYKFTVYQPEPTINSDLKNSSGIINIKYTKENEDAVIYNATDSILVIDLKAGCSGSIENGEALLPKSRGDDVCIDENATPGYVEAGDQSSVQTDRLVRSSSKRKRLNKLPGGRASKVRRLEPTEIPAIKKTDIPLEKGQRKNNLNVASGTVLAFAACINRNLGPEKYKDTNFSYANHDKLSPPPPSKLPNKWSYEGGTAYSNEEFKGYESSENIPRAESMHEADSNDGTWIPPSQPEKGTNLG